MNTPAFGELFIHLKTGSMYRVHGISTCSTNGAEEGKQVVVYQKFVDYAMGNHNNIFHRSLEEFCDGRFEKR